MASIQKIKAPITNRISYRAQVRVKGHETQSKTFPNKREAQQWATGVEAAIRENRNFPHLRAMRTSFSEVATRYRESVLIGSKRAVKYDQHLQWWEKKLVGKTLGEITPDVVAKARDELAAGTYARGKERVNKRTGVVVSPKSYKRSGSTVNRYLGTLSHLFTIAKKDWRLVDKNPVTEISKKRESRGRVRFLSDEERERLLEACANSQWSSLLALVLLAISTGARRSELINLKWIDVDLKKSRAIVHETKNGDPRTLPLVGRALDAIRELKLKDSARSEYVFPQPSGFPGPYLHFESHWYAALEAAGIENMRFHDLRHTTASYLAQQGASLLEIADTLGHRTMAMVKRYAHLTQTHKVAAIERMTRERGL